MATAGIIDTIGKPIEALLARAAAADRLAASSAALRDAPIYVDFADWEQFARVMTGDLRIKHPFFGNPRHSHARNRNELFTLHRRSGTGPLLSRIYLYAGIVAPLQEYTPISSWSDLIRPSLISKLVEMRCADHVRA